MPTAGRGRPLRAGGGAGILKTATVASIPEWVRPGGLMAQPIRCPTCGSLALPEEHTPPPWRCGHCGGLLESTGGEDDTATTAYRARSGAAPSFAPALVVRGFRLLGELGRG